MYRFPMSPEGAKIIVNEMQRKREERAALEKTCCNGNCNQGRTCPQRAKRADQGSQGPRSHYRWPAGIGYHAGALAALAFFGGIAVWVYEVWK